MCAFFFLPWEPPCVSFRTDGTGPCAREFATVCGRQSAGARGQIPPSATPYGAGLYLFVLQPQRGPNAKSPPRDFRFPAPSSSSASCAKGSSGTWLGLPILLCVSLTQWRKKNGSHQPSQLSMVSCRHPYLRKSSRDPILLFALADTNFSCLGGLHVMLGRVRRVKGCTLCCHQSEFEPTSKVPE